MQEEEEEWYGSWISINCCICLRMALRYCYLLLRMCTEVPILLVPIFLDILFSYFVLLVIMYTIMYVNCIYPSSLSHWCDWHWW